MHESPVRADPPLVPGTYAARHDEPVAVDSDVELPPAAAGSAEPVFPRRPLAFAAHGEPVESTMRWMGPVGRRFSFVSSLAQRRDRVVWSGASARSYSAQFRTRYFVLYFGWTLDRFVLIRLVSALRLGSIIEARSRGEFRFMHQRLARGQAAA